MPGSAGGKRKETEMGTRYYHGSGNHRTSNGSVVEMFNVLGKMIWGAVVLAVALAILLVGGLAWAVTWGKWNGARAIMRASGKVAPAAFGG